jgi:hypothetical protein
MVSLSSVLELWITLNIIITIIILNYNIMILETCLDCKLSSSGQSEWSQLMCQLSQTTKRLKSAFFKPSYINVINTVSTIRSYRTIYLSNSHLQSRLPTSPLILTAYTRIPLFELPSSNIRYFYSFIQSAIKTSH